MTFHEGTVENIIRAFSYLQTEIHGTACAKGFWDDDRNFGEMVALMHSELSEALEADRKNLMSDKIPGCNGVAEEMADCVIRILDYCESAEIDLADVILKKMAYNQTREYRHGKKY